MHCGKHIDCPVLVSQKMFGDPVREEGWWICERIVANRRRRGAHILIWVPSWEYASLKTMHPLQDVWQRLSYYIVLSKVKRLPSLQEKEGKHHEGKTGP